MSRQQRSGAGSLREFHVSRAARDRYGVADSLFTLSGNVILADFAATRALARRMNERRDIASLPERTVQAGHLNAMGLIDEILHHVVERYRREANPQVGADALDWLDGRLGPTVVDEALTQFADRFPTVAVHRGRINAASYLAASTEGVPNRQIALEELLLLWLANVNPAFGPFADLFDAGPLREATAYDRIVTSIAGFFSSQPPFGPDGESLVTMLRSPAVAVPDSLAGQLQFIRERWGLLLGEYLGRLEVNLGVLKEEETALWMRFHPHAGGAGASAAGPGLGGRGAYDVGEETERFSQDRDWMPRVVLLAKSTYVWLDQLSRRYGREIRRLDEIPDEELDTLARWGITGLWLIGLWERSRASQRIKQMRGNADAVASAYSLLDYRIADDLGGEAAYELLRDRAGSHGIRLSADMVPNHMGIDSTWLVEHPDWFLSVPDSPYPSYSFGGRDLSSDDRVGIFLEDHYFDGTDAAVVFRRLDRATGEERFIYHGNDGTSTPWNDTAQLNYLNPAAREAVIQTILAVARRFPIIRFDAAMTLARKHVRRLWFPEPGQGGAIPSRAEHAVPREAFEAAMPLEFWREVVDRVAAEVPDTLLLAEAFWLMEGYFVRTLGMHRVYNSAFMHMLRDEKNAEYRRVIRDTLEFDPEILKRYVNFMNNPDERSAVDQFGKGDKYFGVATLLATLPGLPMFGHGQVEGFSEKYGMEFRRAYQDEQPDQWLVGRHEQEIFPLLHRRWLFAEARDFLLYDVVTADGSVDENVFAYSNRAGEERSLVVYHNRYASTSGWVRTSVAFSVPDGSGGRRLVRRSLGEGLGLHREAEYLVIFRESRSGQEFIRPSAELWNDGLFVELDAYRCQVFLGMREVRDVGGQYRRLAGRLGGRGVPSIDAALRELQLAPVHDAFRALAGSDTLQQLVHLGAALASAARPAATPASDGPVASALARAAGPRVVDGATDELDADGTQKGETQPAPDEAAASTAAADTAPVDPAQLLGDVESRSIALLRAIAEATGAQVEPAPIAAAIRARIGATLALAARSPSEPEPGSQFGDAARGLREGLEGPANWAALLSWAILSPLGRIGGEDGVAERSRRWLDELQLTGALAGVLRSVGLDESTAWRVVDLVKVLVALPRPSGKTGDPQALLARFLGATDVRQFIRVNTWEGAAWFEKEAFEQLLWWASVLGAVDAVEAAPAEVEPAADPLVQARLIADHAVVGRLRAAGAEAGYRLDLLEEVVARP